MKKILILSAILFIGCNKDVMPTSPITINIQNQNQNNNGGQPGNPPSTSCNQVRSVDIRVPVSVSVGQSVELDATPKDVEGNPRSKACDEASGIAWSLLGTCKLSSPNVFNPTLTGSAKGTCSVQALVAGVGSRVASIEVQ